MKKSFYHTKINFKRSAKVSQSVSEHPSPRNTNAAGQIKLTNEEHEIEKIKKLLIGSSNQGEDKGLSGEK